MQLVSAVVVVPGWVLEAAKRSGWITSTISPVIPLVLVVTTIPLNRDYVFADHYEVNGAVVSIGGINVGSAEARFTAKDDPDTGETMLWAMERRIPSPP